MKDLTSIIGSVFNITYNVECMCSTALHILLNYKQS